MSQDLWTFVASFEGGTYINQVEAKSVDAAVDEYVELKFAEVCKAAKVKSFHLDEYSKIFNPIPTNDTKSVYCISILTPRSLRRLKGGHFIIDIIKTVP